MTATTPPTDRTSTAAASEALKPAQCLTAEAAVRNFFEHMGAVGGGEIKMENPSDPVLTLADYRRAIQLDRDFAPMVVRFHRDALMTRSILGLVEQISTQNKRLTADKGILAQAFQEAINLVLPDEGCLEAFYSCFASGYVQMKRGLDRVPVLGISLLFLINCILCLLAAVIILCTFGFALNAACAIKNRVDALSRGN